MKKSASIFLLVVLFLIPYKAGDLIAQDSLFSNCGVIMEGEECTVFVPDGDTIGILLENYYIYGPGDSVYVVGEIVGYEDTLCVDVDLIVERNTIAPCQGGEPMIYYEGYGTLISIDNCLMYDPNGLEYDYVMLGDYGGMMAGDSVYVFGWLDFSCESECQYVIGCIDSVGIALILRPTNYNYQSYGVLFQGTNCLLFAPQGDINSPYALENYGPFQEGDYVQIIGDYVAGCPTPCVEAVACINNNTIDSNYMPSTTIPGYAIVELEQDVTLEEIYDDTCYFVIDSIYEKNMYLMSFPDSISANLLISQLMSIPEVIYAEPIFQVDLPENLQLSISFPDEYAPALDIENDQPGEFFNQTFLQVINADSAGEISTGEGAIVAVIDNGFDFNHPFLDGAFFSDGYDFYNDDPDPSPDSGTGNSHGTFVAGLIRLIAPDCSMIPLKALNETGQGNSFAIVKAIYAAIDQNANIINMSFGSYQDSYFLRTACDEALTAGLILVAAAGNDSTNVPIYPAAYSGVISVAALDTLEYVTPYSNYGPTIDICAPGSDLYSCLTGEFDWGRWTGTSFSTPQVSALCAMMHSLDTDMTPYEIETHIHITANTELLWGTITAPDPHYGYGKLDLTRALLGLCAPLPPGNCGDVNNDDNVNISDAVCIINYIFHGNSINPESIDNSDVNSDAMVNISDALFLINYIFLEGPTPNCP